MENIKTGLCSIIGDRAYQQDVCECIQMGNRYLAVVCDGMGGMQGGERASAEAIASIQQSFKENWQMPLEQIPYWFRDVFLNTNQKIVQLCDENGNLLHAGTTVVAVIIEDNKFYWGAVGDSRIYFLRDESISVITRMHNYHMKIDDMLAKGQLLPYEAEAERNQGEALISFLGIDKLEIMDINLEPIIMLPGDQVVLSSDGLYRSLNEEQVQAIVEESGGNAEIAARRLCSNAFRLAPGKQDNTTVVVMNYGERREAE